jgi:hypothetical protein
MYPTAEVRWFYKGTMPSEIHAWFQNKGLPPPEAQPPRVDRYLRIMDSDSLGIKLRGGGQTPRLEIKQRVPDSPFSAQIIQLHPRVAGVVEHWRKWSQPLAELDWDPVPATAWVRVRKARLMHTFRIMGSEIVHGRGHAWPSPTPGCELELSTINAADQTWWSLCFEAFGEDAGIEPTKLYEMLCRVAKHVFTAYGSSLPAGIVSFDIQDSYGYPQWLAHIFQ